MSNIKRFQEIQKIELKKLRRSHERFEGFIPEHKINEVRQQLKRDGVRFRTDRVVGERGEILYEVWVR